MGCKVTKPVNDSDIDLFQNTETSSLEDSNSTSSNQDDRFKLSDTFSFSQLSKQVFEVGSDCIKIDGDSAGPMSGRISSVYEIENCFGKKFLAVSFMVIKSSGTVFFRSQQAAYIQEYDGKMKLSDLPLRPLRGEEKNALKERGRLFVKYGLGSHHMLYKDKMVLQSMCGCVRVSAEGRVMVDTSLFLHFNPNYGSLAHEARHYQDDDDGCHGRSYGGGRNSNDCATEIPESSLHLCWNTLCGYSLKSKRWGELAVSALSEIEYSEDAFSMLVLEEESKAMVRGLVENIHKEKQFTDIISGKGGGCSFLLQGDPGVGKTLTAEAVAESLHRPLYCIDVGELGITPESLEKNLKEILEMAERWNAVVLIDECDIFLSRRDQQTNILRNAMVGIFLRLLEYYNGILFLTSNRADDLDEAFQSRISVTLQYKSFDSKTRKQVWSNLLSAAGVDDDKGLDIDKLAEYELNGRQIKTAIRLAMSLAGTAKEVINLGHLEQTIGYANVGNAS